MLRQGVCEVFVCVNFAQLVFASYHAVLYPQLLHFNVPYFSESFAVCNPLRRARVGEYTQLE